MNHPLSRTHLGRIRHRLHGLSLAACGLVLAVLGSSASGYPLDGEKGSGIRRLEGYRLAQQSPTGPKLPAGALLSTADIELRLRGLDVPDFDTRPEDPALSESLAALFEGRDPSYAVVVVDISNPERIRWAGLRPDTRQNVGSVGKIITMTSLFHVLAEAFPNIEDRRRILATSKVRAGDWVTGDAHAVPRFDAAAGANRFARLRPEDEFYLSEWLDHAVSASANGAGSVVWREAMLIREFGDEYPLSWEETQAFFDHTSKSELSALAQSIMLEPLRAVGIDTDVMRQGSFWTRTAQQRVPGTTSFATPRELARFMMRLEQGRLVDPWSSLEMKKYLYMTKRRYRYVYAPELKDAAVFFKSGSLYSCRPEEGFRCGRYMGNQRNYMNSAVVIESPAGREPDNVYIVTMLSNVLRFNSAWDHSRFGAAIQEMMQRGEPVDVRENASASELVEAGTSD
jgi:hypothetical protein